MEREALNILERMADNFRRHGHDMGDAVSARSPDRYTDPARYAAEIATVFREMPQFVCHVSQLRAPGSFVTATIAGTPIVVTRDDAGSLNAFVNACVHRGAQVVREPCGRRGDFLCPFHGWAYDLAGKLTHVTDRESFAGATLDDARMSPLPVIEKHGLVFVRLTPGPIDIDLGTMGEQLDSFGLADHEFFCDGAVVNDYNWKLAIDGSLETYHLNYLHPAAARTFTGNASLFDFYGDHTRFITARRSLAKLEPVDPALLRREVMITFAIFPTTFVTTPHDHVLIQTIRPLSVGRSEMVMSLLKPPGAGPETDDHWRKSWEMNQLVQIDDFAIWESIQRAYAGGFDQPALFGRYEHAIARYHDRLDAMLERR